MNSAAYFRLVQTGLLSVYRDRSMLVTDLLIATCVPFFIQFAIWRFVYDGAATDTVPQYSLEETYRYYVAVLALNRLNNAYDLIVRVSTHVHEGQLEGIFVKPISYFKYNFFSLSVEVFFTIFLLLLLRFL